MRLAIAILLATTLSLALSPVSRAAEAVAALPPTPAAAAPAVGATPAPATLAQLQDRFRALQNERQQLTTRLGQLDVMLAETRGGIAAMSGEFRLPLAGPDTVAKE